MTPAALSGGLVVASMWAARQLSRRSRPPARVPGADTHPAMEGAPPAWLGRWSDDAALPWPPGTVWRWWRASIVVAVGGALALGGIALAVVALATSVAAPAAVLHTLRHRADERLEAALPELLESVARSLRSGASLAVALADSAAAGGPLAGDVEQVARAAARVGLVAALDRWADRRPLAGVRLAAATLALAASTGGAAARAVDGTALTLRARLDTTAEVRALSSQARASGWLIAVAPMGFGALSAAVDPRTAYFLFRTTPGAVVLATALLLDGIGAGWMQHLAGGPR